MIWKDLRVLVTGAAGVIGRELLDLLIDSGAKVLAIDRVSLPPTYVDRVHFARVDLIDSDLSLISDFKPEVVFHLAAAFERSEETDGFWHVNFRDNVTVTHRVADVLQSCGNKPVVVFASSYLVYSTDLYLFPTVPPTPVRLREQDDVRARNLCGAAKLYGEHELFFLHERGLLRRVISARIFRVFGRGSRDVISRWVRAALAGDEITVYGWDNRFDYIYAGDVAEALFRLAGCSEASGPVNVGLGRAQSIREVVMILRQMIPTLRIRDAAEPYRVEASEADISRLRTLTGWAPTVDLREGIRRIIEYEKE